MVSPQSLPWREPLDVAACIDEPYMALLYSGVKTSYSGRYSYLAYGLRERVESADFSGFTDKLSEDKPRFDNLWVGYLGYGLKDCLETLTPDAPNWLELANLCMMRFHNIIEFDHETKTLRLFSDKPTSLPAALPEKPIYLPRVSAFGSNMSKKEYMGKVEDIVRRIHAGDLYQANLTRKFTGNFAETFKPFDLFRKLYNVSPAPYSAFLRMGDVSVISSSPELFLSIDASGHVRTRPIKGTSPRFNDPARDDESRQSLATSAKDQAENLMIVDLMRNDLSRSCAPGSVRTETLFEVTSHANVHHMSSTITGQKRQGCSTLDVVKGCFPPGSMTGAPKIGAMNLCSTMEKLQRGIYSGAIGWFGGDGSAELSVVIRTLIVQDTRFEFQVGGGIVADSTPEREWQETMDKASGILRALGAAQADINF